MLERLRSLLNPRNIKLPAQRAAFLTVLVVLIAGLVASLFLATVVARQARDDYRNTLNQKSTVVQSRVSTIMSGYSQLLYSGATLFSLKGDVSRSDWTAFYQDMKVEQELPSTLGVGYVTYLKPSDVSDFEQRTQSEGYPNFVVSPTYERNEYTAITYLEPFNSVNQKAFGYDMMSDPQRNAAMTIARDMGTVDMSSPVNLVQDEGTPVNRNKGVIIYYPVYKTGVPLTSIDERRAGVKGFVYTVLRPNDVLQAYLKAFPQVGNGVTIYIKDITDGSDIEVAASHNSALVDSETETVTQQVAILNRTWQISVQGKPAAANSVIMPAAIIILGSLASLVVSGLMFQMLLKRIEHVEKTYEAEVERTKDELLALASHQLRTPASGVKQYIGILTSGIVGELTASQQQIAEKAYRTNERQIEIINQLLYVSKIEAGKITIKPERSNITPAIRRVVDQSVSEAERKNIKVIFRTKQPHYIYGDEQYYPMIIDNLISNAIKYSYHDSTVVIKVGSREDYVAVSVVDRGVGIADHDRKYLFNKFNRIENTLSRTEGGSGLGLFLAYQLARAHGGNIEVMSTEGKGSTFTLLLPKKPYVKEAVVDIVQRSNEPELPMTLE